jgi:cell division septation protein DedD
VAPTQDEAFHEIQLNGKQLVFLFMAATVVSVVIFLCGVLVGRNVRAERSQVDVPTTSADLTPSSAPAQTPASENAPAYTGLDKPGSKDDLLKKPERSPKAETAAPVSTPPPASAPVPEPKATASVETPPAATPAPETAAPAPEKAAPPSVPKPSATAGTEPSDKGYAVQIAAVNARSEADAMAKRLASKGYSAYVLAPASGTPPVYRVRVGKFPTKREAETVAAKLQKEEQLKPWVTR